MRRAASARRGTSRPRRPSAPRFVLRRQGHPAACPLGLPHRGALWPARWTWNGRRTARPVNYSSSRRDRKPCSPAAKRVHCVPTASNRKGDALLSGLSIGDAVVAGRVCLIESPKDIDRFRRRRRSGHARDRSRLGADHEARGGDRHRSRRPHVACGHRQPRIGIAGGRRNRGCDARPARRAGNHRLLRRRRRRLHL